jgi:hypothetical protein
MMKTLLVICVLTLGGASSLLSQNTVTVVVSGSIDTSGTQDLYHHEDPAKLRLLQQQIETEKEANAEKIRAEHERTMIEAKRLADEKKARQEQANKEELEAWQKWTASVRMKPTENNSIQAG